MTVPLRQRKGQPRLPYRRTEEIRWFSVMEKTTLKKKKMAKNYTFKNLTGGNKIHTGIR
jgi:hypothetical protein